MSLVNYDPWTSVRNLQGDINRLFSTWATNDSSGVTADWVPTVDVNEFEDRFQLFVDIPGVDPRNVEITLENGALTISGERLGDSVNDNDNALRRRTERGSGRFYRRFVLPNTVDADNVKASNNFGVLEVSIPKQAKAMPRRIEIAA